MQLFSEHYTAQQRIKSVFLKLYNMDKVPITMSSKLVLFGKMKINLSYPKNVDIDSNNFNKKAFQ